jgi:UDP-glucuronate decarboxylase
MKTKNMALVAGGAGFIGSHICDRLIEDGFHVLCFDNLQTGRESNIRHLSRESQFDFIEGDVVNPLPASVTRHAKSLTFVFNLACAASPPHYQADPEHTMLTNVLGTTHLLRLAEKAGARFLLSSTSEVYGDPEVHPQREDYRGWVNCTGPRACYDEGKRAAETLAFDYDRLGRAEVRVARIFNTYGPRMRPDDGRVVSNVICQALSGDDITIYGDGSQTRSFCYADDLVDGLIRLSRYEGAQPGPINLGNPVELTVSDLADRVISLTGTDAELVYRPLPIDDPRRRRPDIGKAKQLLKWQPRVALQEGLEQTIAWFAREADRGDVRAEVVSAAVAAE